MCLWEFLDGLRANSFTCSSLCHTIAGGVAAHWNHLPEAPHNSFFFSFFSLFCFFSPQKLFSSNKGMRPLLFLALISLLVPIEAGFGDWVKVWPTLFPCFVLFCFSFPHPITLRSHNHCVSLLIPSLRFDHFPSAFFLLLFFLLLFFFFVFTLLLGSRKECCQCCQEDWKRCT